MNQVILYLTNKLDEISVENYLKLKNEISNKYDLIILFHKDDNTDVPEFLNNHEHFIFTNDDVFNKLGYKHMGEEKELVPGNTHFPIFYFMKNYHKKYDYYWRIENDVYFNGDWCYFFDSIPNYYDFVASHIDIKNKNNLNWYWFYHLFKNNFSGFYTGMLHLKSFTPVMRLSYDAMVYLDEKFLSGVCGHFEFSIPTLLFHKNFKIGDYGGTNTFTINGFENLYYKYISNDDDVENNKTDNDFSYTKFTFRYKPVFKKEDMVLSNVLYHPYKKIIDEEDDKEIS